MKNVELVIFDCDGVLVDSEVITNRVFASMLNELGAAVTVEDMFERFVGHSMERCLAFAAELLGGPLPEDFVARYLARTSAALHSELRAVPGVESALDRLRIPACVASNGSHEKMRSTLGLTGLLARFEGRLVSAAEVARPKPAPDLFLLAAERFGAAPSACAVVEDSPAGVTAGVAAGMTVVGFGAATPPHRLREAGARYVVSEMSELPRLLHAL